MKRLILIPCVCLFLLSIACLPNPLSKLATEKPTEKVKETEEQKIDKICTHLWWNRPQSRTHIDKLLDDIIKLNAGEKDGFYPAIVVDATGDFAPAKYVKDPYYWFDTRQMQSPKIYVDAGGWRSRPNREQCVWSLLRQLDQAEIDHGPGRGPNQRPKR